jgi:tetratricopeptide (TPR) repeat protein
MLERTGPLPADLWNAAIDVAAALRDDARVRELVGTKYLDEIRDPGEMVRIASALARIDEAAAAMTCFQRAIDLAPHAPEPWTAAIRHLVRRNQRSDALVLANQAKTKAPARYRTFITAQCAEALGEWAAADSTYRKALEERPKDALHRLAFADFLVSIDRPREAATEYRTVIDGAAVPEIAARARRGLAAILADRRLEAYLDGLDAAKRTDAIRVLESSTGLPAADRFRLVQLLDLSGQTEAAARHRERILTEQVETGAMLAYFIRTLLAQDRADAADPLLERLRQTEPNTPRTAEMTRLRRAVGGIS